jgi:hypothetical protein
VQALAQVKAPGQVRVQVQARAPPKTPLVLPVLRTPLLPVLVLRTPLVLPVPVLRTSLVLLVPVLVPRTPLLPVPVPRTTAAMPKPP